MGLSRRKASRTGWPFYSGWSGLGAGWNPDGNWDDEGDGSSSASEAWDFRYDNLSQLVGCGPSSFTGPARDMPNFGFGASK